VPKIPKNEFHTRREQQERERAEKADSDIARRLHREMAHLHRIESTRSDDGKPKLDLVAGSTLSTSVRF
jgi:hypothetical protein